MGIPLSEELANWPDYYALFKRDALMVFREPLAPEVAPHIKLIQILTSEEQLDAWKDWKKRQPSEAEAKRLPGPGQIETLLEDALDGGATSILVDGQKGTPRDQYDHGEALDLITAINRIVHHRNGSGGAERGDGGPGQTAPRPPGPSV